MEGAAAEHHGHLYGHHAVSAMDLHMTQQFAYYRRASVPEEMAAQGNINTRILELRKEKSRDAARSRRGKENFEFYELAKMLPLPTAITSQLDKASIIRLTIAYLRLRDFADAAAPAWTRDPKSTTTSASTLTSASASDVFGQHEGTHILQSLDGFALALNSDGRFLYISETVSIYLGLSQVELTGSSIFDYVHQADHLELASQLGVTLAHQQRLTSSLGAKAAAELAANADPHKPFSVGAAPAIPDVCYPVTSLMHAHVNKGSGPTAYDRAFCLRMKSTLTKRGCHFKSSGYRVVLLLGKLRPQQQTQQQQAQQRGLRGVGGKMGSVVAGFIGLAIALPPPSVHEVRLESDMFVTRLTFDFTIAHCEPKVADLLDYGPDEMTGRSMYALCHGEDVEKMKKTHEDLLNKGQVMSNYYRILNKRGGFTWMQSCATLICNTKNADEQSIICVNYVLSGPQFSSFVMDEGQQTTTVKSRQGGTKNDNSGSNNNTFNEPSAKSSSKSERSKRGQGKDKGDRRGGSSNTLCSNESNSGTMGNPMTMNEAVVTGFDKVAMESHEAMGANTNREWPLWRPPALL